jgi:CheY-like chemotaxis protein
MNIRKEHIDALNAVVKITIGKYEYTEKIENFLEVKRKTATLPGFRKGKTPMDVVRKQFEKPAIIEEVTALVNKGLKDYIAKEKLDSIFESFNQASNDTTRKFGGSGLGLTITKKLIELQGGRILVESEVNRGSKFSFTLIFEKVQNEFIVEQLNELPIVINPEFLIGKKIIMAEDILINQLLVSKIFQKWNCQLDIVNDGKEVVFQIENEEYDLILMDLQMPIMDGYEATKAIRNVYQNEIPIIALSAHANKIERDKCLNFGMNALVSKPIDEELLLLEMFKCLNGAKEIEFKEIEVVKKENHEDNKKEN